MRLRSIYTGLALALALAAPACGNDATGPSNAPASHTLSRGGVRHAPGLDDPQLNCASCHGTDLLGTAEAPSCYRCHDQKWS